MNFYHGDRYIIKFNGEDGKYWKYLEKNKGIDRYNREQIKFPINVYNNIQYVALSKNPKCITYKTNGTERVICNFAEKGFSTNYDDINNIGKIFTEPSGNDYWLGLSKGTTLEEAKNKLEGIEIIYILKEPELIPIEPIDIMNMTYYPTTNCFASIDNINIKAKYYRDFVNTIRNLQVDNGTLKTQLQDIEKRLQVVEAIPTTIEPTVEEVIPNA